MEEGNKQVMEFCKLCRLRELIKEADKLMLELDVTYEEISGDAKED